MLLPTRVAVTQNDKESKNTKEAWDVETKTPSQLHITDAYLLLHSHHMHVQERSRWTWGFSASNTTRVKKVHKIEPQTCERNTRRVGHHRVDKTLESEPLHEACVACYPTVLAGSDNKCVVLK